MLFIGPPRSMFDEVGNGVGDGGAGVGGYFTGIKR
jgi:hypothetical protein